MSKYLYNGVELPDINEVWTDKETYPYITLEWDEKAVDGVIAACVNFNVGGQCLCSLDNRHRLDINLTRAGNLCVEQAFASKQNCL